MLKIVTSKIELPFPDYKWIWSTWTNREVFNTPSLWLAILRKLRKYEGKQYSTSAESGKELHSEVESMGLKGPDGKVISFVSGEDERSFLRGYAVYWTTIGVLVPFKATGGVIRLTKIGHLIASGSISFREFAESVVKKLQLPNPTLNEEVVINSWIEASVQIKPLSYLLAVYCEIFDIAGYGECYLTEKEVAIIVVPMAWNHNPQQVAQEVLTWRNNNANINYYYTGFAENSHEFRNIKEHLQFLSSAGFLLVSKMNTKDLQVNSGEATSDNALSNCYFINIIGESKYEQHAIMNSMLDPIKALIEQANDIGFYDFNAVGEDEVVLDFCENYLGGYDYELAATPKVQIEVDRFIEILEKDKQIILYGPPGTGKTMTASAIVDELRTRGNLGDSLAVQFHQGMSYEDFIEGIRPRVDTSQGLSYAYTDGLFKSFVNQALTNQDKYYVAIIDEINRANIASVLGELIFLLEPSYRHPKAAVTLPYTRDLFYIPQNVLLIGTMNSTDRGATEIDMALRRRFRFIKTKVNYQALDLFLESNKAVQEYQDGGKFDISNALEVLNRIIEEDASLGEDYCIGHSYFMLSEDKPYRESLHAALNYSVIPLLEEYLLLSTELREALSALGFQVKGHGIAEIDIDTMENIIKNLEQG